jgi:hypothetical protein
MLLLLFGQIAVMADQYLLLASTEGHPPFFEDSASVLVAGSGRNNNKPDTNQLCLAAQYSLPSPRSPS